MANGQGGRAEADVAALVVAAHGVVTLRDIGAGPKFSVERPQEAGLDDGVGIDEHEGVVGTVAHREAIDQPAEGRALAGVGEVVSFVGLSPARPHEVGRPVGAVVGDDVDLDAIGGVVDRPHRGDRLGDQRLLVVGGHEDPEVRGGLGGVEYPAPAPETEQCRTADQHEVAAPDRGEGGGDRGGNGENAPEQGDHQNRPRWRATASANTSAYTRTSMRSTATSRAAAPSASAAAGSAISSSMTERRPATSPGST